MITACKKCNNNDPSKMAIQQSGPHKKLICAECGSYMKFATKEEVNLIKIKGGKVI